MKSMLQKSPPHVELDSSHGLTLRLFSEDRPFIRKLILNRVTNIPFKDLFPKHFSFDRIDEKSLLTTIYFEECSKKLKNYFEGILYELELGISSPYHAARILEMNAFSMDEKKGLIQDRILAVIHRFPRLFDYDLFQEMQRFLLTVSDQYFRMRSVREIGKTLMAFYVIRQRVFSKSEKSLRERHVEVKLFRRRLMLPLGSQDVLEVIIGMNSLRENELFKKEHLLKAIQNILPEAKLIAGSDYLDQEKKQSLHLITLEIEKEKGFEKGELLDLKRWLPRIIKGKIEHLQRALFMPRNEEEILKHLITLGQELRFFSDLPQVILSFEKQTETKLVFTVILARLLLPDEVSLEDLLFSSSLQIQIDRIKYLGMLRKKYPKEGAVLNVELSLKGFLREDLSIDLYRARQSILSHFHKIFGRVRDYNGGMISRQNEVFQVLEKTLGRVGRTYHHLLETFFHSLFPLEKRSIVDPHILKHFFLLLVEKMETGQTAVTKEVGGYHYTVTDFNGLETFQETCSFFISLDLEYDERMYKGFIIKKGEC